MAYRDLWKLDWGVIFRRAWYEILLDDCFGASAQLAYFFLLAFFPFILFVATLATMLAGHLPVQRLDSGLRDLLWQIMPMQALDLVMDTVTRILHALREKRVGMLSMSAVLALWTSSTGLRAVMVTLNRAYNVREGRPIWRRYMLSLGLTVALSLGGILALLLLSLYAHVGHAIARLAWPALAPTLATAWNLASRAAALGALILVLELVYYLAPNARRAWHWITPGSILAVLLWLAATWLFSHYVSHFGRYEAMYARLGAPVVLLLWFYLLGLAILVGGEINAEIERASGLSPRMSVPAPRGVDAAGHETWVRDAAVESAGPSAASPDAATARTSGDSGMRGGL